MRYIAIIDILGFGQFVAANDLETIVRFYAPLLTGTHYSIDMDVGSGPPLEYQVYSDTICILTQDDSIESLTKLIRVCHLELSAYFHLLNEHSSGRLPVRGAIAKSDILFGNHVFHTQAWGRERVTTNPIPALLGKAVVQADRWEKQQEWMGISFCPDLYTEALGDQEKYELLLASHLLIPYSVPTKDKGQVMTLVVNPIETFQIDRILPILASKQENDQLHNKVANTMAFLEHIKAKNLCYPKPV